jgi:hypothetical protein
MVKSPCQINHSAGAAHLNSAPAALSDGNLKTRASHDDRIPPNDRVDLTPSHQAPTSNPHS